MKAAPVVVATQAVTGLSSTLDGTWDALLAGKSALAPITRFPVAHYASQLGAVIDGLAPNGAPSMVHDLLSRLFQGFPPVPPDTFLITASTKGGIDALEKASRELPFDPRDMLLSSLPDILCKKMGLSEGGINISAACASSTIALAKGAAMIASGRRDAVLVCGLDLLTEFSFSGFAALKALSPEASRPFDRDRQGLSLGEGAAALLLMSGARADRENRPSLGRILGWGIAGDATHITAPARDGCGLVQATTEAIRRAGLSSANDISAVSAHGTGTIYNDQMEITAFRKVFGERALPVFSIKGAIGHTLGAAGGIEAALGLKVLSAQIAPPTAGVKHPTPGAEGWVDSKPVPFSGDYLLSTNSGFGGINAALVLGRSL